MGCEGVDEGGPCVLTEVALRGVRGGAERAIYRGGDDGAARRGFVSYCWDTAVYGGSVHGAAVTAHCGQQDSMDTLYAALYS